MGKHKWLLIIPISLILLQLYYTPVASSNEIRSSNDGWTMFLHDLSHNGYTPGNVSTDPARKLWAFKTWKAVKSSPAVADGYLLIGSRDWRIYCLNSSTGKQLWNYSTENEVNSSPAIHNGSVYAGSDDGYFYCLDVATGMLLWKREVGGLARSSPAIVDGVVYLGGDFGVFCLNASNGAIIWSHPTSNRVHSSPAVVEGVVYFASDDFFVYALNASSGEELWRRHTGSVFSSPCVYNGFVYIGSTDGFICALNASTGTETWEYLTAGSISSSPAVAYGRVFVGSDDNNVYCLNASSGHELWRSPTGYWVRSSPAVAQGNVYVGSEDFSIYCLDCVTGVKKWSYETGSSVDSSPAIVDGELFVGSCDYSVYAFALGNTGGALMPSQSANSLPWTAIVFDAIACTVAAAITLTIARFVLSERPRKHETRKVVSFGWKIWITTHADAICLLAILSFSAVFFVDLGNGPLWATDEQTYSQWAYHMFKTGDYLTPWSFGQLEIGIGKPPLFMWLMSLAYQIFGVSNFASRFWSPVFATFSLVLVFYLGKKFYNSFVGILSAFILGTFTTFYVFAKHAMTDVTFVFFILASVYFLLLNEKGEGSKRYAGLAGLFLGLAFLTKQLQALLIPLIIFSYFIVTRRGIRFLFTKRFALFWQVGIVVVSPWLIYMILRFGPDFWNSHFVFSGITRAVSPIEGHVEGYLYYFNYLVNKENLLWVVLLPFAAGLCLFNAVAKRSKKDSLVFAWIVIVLAFFTFAQTKLFWYILPAFPAFAIAISNFLFQLLKRIPISIRWVYRNMSRMAAVFWRVFSLPNRRIPRFSASSKPLPVAFERQFYLLTSTMRETTMNAIPAHKRLPVRNQTTRPIMAPGIMNSSILAIRMIMTKPTTTSGTETEVRKALAILEH